MSLFFLFVYVCVCVCVCGVYVCVVCVSSGPWTAAEEARLIDVMKEVCAKNNPSGPLPESGEEEEGALPATVSWHDIARSVRTRTAMQCRQKWVMSLSWKSKDSSQMWGVDDTIRLLETLGTIADVVSEDEVDWAGLCRKWPGNWTHYYLRERWGRLRRDVPNYRVKSFQGNGRAVLLFSPLGM